MDKAKFLTKMAGITNGILALGFGMIFSTNVWATGVSVEANQIGDTVHLEFKGQGQWDYNLEKKIDRQSAVFEIEVARLSEPAVMAIKAFKNPMVEKVSVNHEGSDGKDVISIRMKDKDLEAFDYLTDQPSRLIIDFFKNQKKAAIEKDDKVDDSTEEKPASKKTAKKKQAATDRKPSSDGLTVADQGPVLAKNEAAAKTSEASDKTSGIFDGGDPNFERFGIKDYEVKEDSIIASGENYYIEFPMLAIDGNELPKILGKQPVYEIEPKDTEENKQARLLLTLYQNKRYNVFLKAVAWFYEKYPNSQYDEIVKFMWADCHFALWMQDRDLKDFDLSMLRYRQAIDKYKTSPLVERTLMLMGYANMDRGDYLSTLRLFQQNIKERPASPNRDLARLAIAKSYSDLTKFDDAGKLYDEIEAQASAKKYQIQAAFLRGDVEFQRKDFNKAIDIYKNAIKKYPEGINESPNAYYNQAAAYFQLKKPRESLNAYLDFLKKFPSHPFAGFAMTRVGEILDMLGADKTRVMGAYLETYFRYGDSPSSVIARLRLLSSRMSGMKDKEIEKAVADITVLSKKSSLPKIEQFATVLIAEGYANRKDFDKSIDILTKYYQKNPTTADTQLLSNRIVRDINAKIRDLVENKNFVDALKTHEKYVDNWLKNSDRIDTKYNVAQSFEQAGVPKEAERLYRDALNRMTALKGTSGEKQRNIFERLPSTDKVALRLASVEEDLGRDAQAYDFLKSIHDPEQLTESEQIERVQIAARVLEKKAEYGSASRYLVELIKAWKGVPELVAQPYFQLADLEMKTGQKTEALKSYEKIDQLMTDSQGKVPTTIHERSLEKMTDLYMGMGMTDVAVKTYQKLLDKYEGTTPLASYRYRLGKIYFDKGDLAKANDTWTNLKKEKTGFWYDLAQEQLKNSEWRTDYKKYIKRIPAMSNDKDKL